MDSSILPVVHYTAKAYFMYILSHFSFESTYGRCLKRQKTGAKEGDLFVK